MRKAFLILFILVLTGNAWGQALTKKEQQQVMARIDKAATALQTMQCDFVQVKSMSMMKKSIKSAGRMNFRRPNMLRWQYTSPYAYTFILNKDKAYMVSQKSTQEVDVKKNKIFKQITDVITNCITGGNLSDTGYFNATISKAGSHYSVHLIPLKKELKQFYDGMTLHFNKELTFVDMVEIKEKGGDKTTITLSNVRTNAKIDDKVFSIH